MKKLVLVLNQEFFPLLFGNIQSLVDDSSDRLSGIGTPNRTARVDARSTWSTARPDL